MRARTDQLAGIGELVLGVGLLLLVVRPSAQRCGHDARHSHVCGSSRRAAAAATRLSPALARATSVAA